MFQLDEFMNGLDRLYENGRMDLAEEYLTEGMKTARQADDKGGILAVLNELIGYYRVRGEYEKCVLCAKEAMELVRELGLSGTLHHGTTCLNAATGFRAAGRYEEAEAAYREAEKVYASLLEEPDYRLAGLHNNLSLLYAETGRLSEAEKRGLKALDMIRRLPDAQAECATTLTNLGNICFKMHRTARGARYMKEAAALFENLPGNPDPHYPSALAGLAEACFHRGELDEAEAYYRQAMELINRLYGKNDGWQTLNRNREQVLDVKARREAFEKSGICGLDLARSFYEQKGRPMLLEKYPAYADRIAAGLAGEGSECLGLDDVYSTDHDFGPGFCFWLTKEDYEAIGEQLQADYDRLAESFKGIPVRNTTKEGAGRVGVIEIGAFYKRLTGLEHAPDCKTAEGMAAWNRIPLEQLRTAVSGAIFEDKLGEFTRRRREFEACPEKVRLYRLGLCLGKMAQSGQYNYERGRRRRDIGMMQASLAEFIQASAEAGYLLNRQYMPFYKWRLRAMEAFICVQELKGALEQLAGSRPDEEETEERIENVCGIILDELKKQGLTDSDELFLERQKAEVLSRMEKLSGEKTQKEEKSSESDAAPSKEIRTLADEITAMEWQQFTQVKNQGGRASCQEDPYTFDIMRKSQFYTWDLPVLESYQEDLKEAKQSGWNLLTEKYARMMEHTAPEEYDALKDRLPYRDPARKVLEELLVSLMMDWTRETAEKFPSVMSMGRSLSASEDGMFNTSSETYLKGELGTYSDKTLKLYAAMLLKRMKDGRNPVRETLEHTVAFYGYPSLEEAEQKLGRR